jgi:uncharacterized protein YukE
MQAPDPGPGYAVSTQMLNSTAGFLNDQATGLASLRDGFNSSCDTAKNAFGSGSASQSFNEFFQAWFSAFDAQAETMGSVADATQQCAVLYDHAERTVLGYVPAMPTAPPPKQQPPSLFGNQRPPMA